MAESYSGVPAGAGAPVGRDGFEHPIEGLMRTAMESIKGMIDVNTVVGQAVATADGGTIIPISKVSFGFAAGGGEYFSKSGHAEPRPFGGGSGAGVTVHPVGFLVVKGDTVRLLSVDRGDLVESLMNTAPQLLDQLQEWLGRGRAAKSASDEPAPPPA
ncbi:MAG: GerW family sporulation protein [Firmicutes bacterium]|nr:GerW family sporulation protein [Alicyclobacillaceae bacterium]MCL6496748.1 GerW family sporulation protein [Bacillota bacterium]